MTTAAKKRRRRQLGQSLIEFAMLVPIIIGMLTLLRQIDMAINAAIVNERYARSTMHYLFFNNRWYPAMGFIPHPSNGGYMSRWWVGVDDKPNYKVEGGDVTPRAPVITIGRGNDGGEDAKTGQDLASVRKRKNVRIRSMAFTCLPFFGYKAGQPFSQGHMPEDAYHVGKARFCDPD